MNVAYICDSSPFYDPEDEYYIQSIQEINMIIKKHGLKEATEFVNAICNLGPMGVVDAQLMMKQIHQFSTPADRLIAFKDYKKWLGKQRYSCLYKDERGNNVRMECTRYIAHMFKNTWHNPEVSYNIKRKNDEKQKEPAIV